VDWQTDLPGASLHFVSVIVPLPLSAAKAGNDAAVRQATIAADKIR
jgi:hypothetical protein